MQDSNYIVKRRIYNQEDFEKNIQHSKDLSLFKHIENNIDERLKIFKKAKYKNLLIFFSNLLPCINWIIHYDVKKFLISDVIAGFTVAFMHIPQGMAYVSLVPLPPVIGLYTSFFPVLIYSIFGTSKHISIGTYAVVSIMLGNVVNKYTNDLPNENSEDLFKLALEVALSISFLVGIIQIILGLIKMGFITTYMSTPIVRGFTSGASMYVFTSQLKPLFGIPYMPSHEGVGNLVKNYIEFFKHIHTANVPTILLSTTCILILIFTKFLTSYYKEHMKFPLPIEFLLVLIGTGVSYAMKLSRYHIVEVGPIPQGMPKFSIPKHNYWLPNIGSAFAIAMVAFFTSFSMAKILGDRHNYEVSPNKELLAYGISTSVGSFFSSITPSASLSRSLVQDSVGGQTQLTGIISCVIILAVILKIGPVFKTLPMAILSSIIVVALRGMFFQLKAIPILYKKNKIDMVLFLITFLSTTFLDVDIGLAVGVLSGLLSLIFRTQLPDIMTLGNIPNTDLYVELKSHPQARPVPQTLIYSFRCFIYYANANIFRDKLYKFFKKVNETIKVKDKDLHPFQNETEKSKKTPEKQPAAKSLSLTRMAKRRNTYSDTRGHENEYFNGVTLSRPSSPDDFGSEFGDASPTHTLTRYNSLISEGKIGLLVHSSPPTPPPRKQDIPDSQPIQIEPNVQIEPTGLKYIILDFTFVSFIDTVGVDVLQHFVRDFHEIDVVVVIACCCDNAYKCLEKSKFFTNFPRNRIFLTIHDAVLWITQP